MIYHILMELWENESDKPILDKLISFKGLMAGISKHKYIFSHMYLNV